MSLFTQNVSELERKSGHNENIKRGILPIVAGICDQVHMCWEVNFLFGTAVTATKDTENGQRKVCKQSGTFASYLLMYLHVASLSSPQC